MTGTLLNRRTTLTAALLVLLLVMTAAAFAQAPVRDHDITIEDYFTQGFIQDCAISPDGGYVAFTDLRWDLDADTRHTDIWIVNTKTNALRRLTFDPANDDSPVWSADSRYVYFTGKRGESDDPAPFNAKTQIWKVSVEGGEAQPVTRFKDGVSSFALSKDGKTLYYVKSSEEVEAPWKDLKEKFDELDYGRGPINFSELWALNLENWRAEKLVDEQRVIGAFAVSTDGQRIAMITTPNEELITNEGLSQVDVWDAASKTVATLPDELFRAQAPSPYGWLEGLTWSADGKKLAFRVDFDGYPAQLLVAHFDGSNITMQQLKRPGEFSLGSSGHMEWLGHSNDLCFISEQRARARVACIRNIRPAAQGSYDILTPGDVVAQGFSLTPDGRILAAALGDVTQPGDIFVTATSSKPNLRRLSRINPQIDTWKLPQIQIVSWFGARGDTVEGILELPYDYKPGQALPLHVALHGGPTDADRYYFEYWIYGRGLWPTLGWAVFAPNYRGSTGYGDKFLTGLIGHEAEIEVEDVLKGVDALVARGIADPEKMAVSGWSNGGFLTNAIITQTDRFKAASSGAGVIDMAIQWGIEDTPGHVVNYMQGLPWQTPDAYRNASPLWNLDKVKTPTLIHVGGQDERVPPANAWALYRGLDFYLKVPTELVVYPGQGHGLRKYTHRKAKLEWDIAWFDHYVLGKPQSEPDKP